MSRLFAFGCSFTQYYWPTWADILGKEFDHYENWGVIGGGNHLILYSLSECILKNNVCQNDLVVIMWSNMAREDRYVDNHWVTPGNIFSQREYDKKFVRKYADEKGYLITNLAIMHAVKKMLEQYNIPHIFTSMVNLDNIDQYKESIIEGVDHIQEEYLDILNFIRPSMFDVIFKRQWITRTFDSEPFNESTLENRYNVMAGADWPSFDKFKTNDLSEVADTIRIELDQIKKWNEFISFKKKDKNKFVDSHPIPLEHLTYIESVIPEITISASTKEWATTINNRLLSNQKFNDLWKEYDHVALDRW